MDWKNEWEKGRNGKVGYESLDGYSSGLEKEDAFEKKKFLSFLLLLKTGTTCFLKRNRWDLRSQ